MFLGDLQLVLALLLILMLAALALSVVAIGTGFQQYMTNYGSSVSIKLSLNEISAHQANASAPLVIWLVLTPFPSLNRHLSSRTLRSACKRFAK